MNEYDIYLEIYGKKLKKKIFARSESEAKEQVKKDIIFHKVVTLPNDEIFNNLMDIINGKK